MAGPDARRPRLPARIRGRLDTGRRLRPLLRRLRHDQRPGDEPLRPGSDEPARAPGVQASLRRRPSALRGRLTPPTGEPPCPCRSSSSTVPMTPSSRWPRPGRSSMRSGPCPTPPCIYAELPYTQHAFDVLPSVRSAHAVAAVVRFLEGVRHRPGPGARPVRRSGDGGPGDHGFPDVASARARTCSGPTTECPACGGPETV